MTEREKIAQLLCKQTGSNENRECETCPFNGCIAQRQADALIKAGIGDVTEYKEIIRDLNTDVVAYRALSKADDLEQIIEGQKSLMDEYKHRAEVAERALIIMAENVLEYAQKAKVTAMTSDGMFSCEKDVQLALLANDALRKAEQKLAEEKKEGNNVARFYCSMDDKEIDITGYVHEENFSTEE